MVYADLHIHTLASDGSLAPAAALEQAKKIGLKALSFTDHESLAGYYQAYKYAREFDLDLLPGIEMVTSFKGQEIHLLGYNFDPYSPGLISALQTICRERNFLARQVIRRLQALGFNLSWEQALKLIPPGGVLGKNHILQLLRQNGYVQEPAQTIEFLRYYLAPGGLAYIPYDGNPLPRAVSLIHAAKGIAILAHPGLIRDEGLLKLILEEGIDGLEVFYYYLGDKGRDAIRYFYRLALDRGFLITGGTDFHGIYAPVEMGAMGISARMVARLKDYKEVPV
ncbi:Phosphoribosyl 1,2-cyclic phosphate 1,2-diphosphodiesterase [Neomoorella glycerini]|uniref:Phosphoribosyl 1,2-cyclic phosphate 1,2-diphosphodiesterase n=1 Tax=Neomoorella glycerini TaxID=55779 RepID=A0A6I5ZVC7_9FIRM|nr:Phosphoribosyl 1,2-cyclic phosphate 1,2-diphosphodiesterase [Moorella glycerini]